MNDDDRQIDWTRALGVKSRAADGLGIDFTKLGDPTKWGGSINTTFQAAGEKFTPTIVHAQCADNYSRNWQLAGTLTMPPFLYTDGVGVSWSGLLLIAMGVGQTTITHALPFHGLIDLAFSFPVYAAFPPVGQKVTFPFVVSGGLVGQRITAWALHVVIEEDEEDYPIEIETSLLLSPLAAGTGL